MKTHSILKESPESPMATCACNSHNREALATTIGNSGSHSEHAIGVASFFSGIGGFDLGFQEAGLQIKFQCEIDEFCTSILEKHWPSVERIGDIREVRNGKDIEKQEVWCAGFPCQDVSLARAEKRKGLAGRNTGLFFDFVRLLGDACPDVVILENVPGLLSSNEGRDFAVVVDALVQLGYGVAWRILDSQYFGVPQSRRRLYIVGYRGDPSRAPAILFEPECGAGHTEKSSLPTKKSVSPFKEVLGTLGKGPVVQRIAYCLAATSGRHTGTDWSRTYVTYDDAVRRLTPLEAERLQGFPDGWTIPDVHSDEMIAQFDSYRYAALGNAVSVPVATWIGDRLINALRPHLPLHASVLKAQPSVNVNARG